MLRVLEAKLKEELEEKTKYQVGWTRFEDKWVGVHLGKVLPEPAVCGRHPISSELEENNAG